MMQDVQNIPNPDVNSVDANEDFGSHSAIEHSPDVDNPNIGKGYGKDDIPPVPPDRLPSAPVEEPPSRGRVPMGDVDDSPKRIAGGDEEKSR